MIRRRTSSLFVLWPVLFAQILALWASLSFSAHYAAADVSASKSHYDLRFGNERYTVATRERWPYALTAPGSLPLWPARAVIVTEISPGDSRSANDSGKENGFVLPADAYLEDGVGRRPVPEGLALAITTGEEQLWYTRDLAISFVWTIIALSSVLGLGITARLLVSSLRAHNRELALRCHECGYPYTAAAGCCPECGHVYTDYERAAASKRRAG